MNAGLIDGDRILSVSSSNMQGRTEVTGFLGAKPAVTDPLVELERLLVQAKQSGDLAEVRSLTDKVNAKMAELEIQEEQSKQWQLQIEIEKCKQQHLQLEIRKTRATSQYPAHGYGGGPLLGYGPPPGYRGQAYRPQYGPIQQYGGPPGYGYGGGFTQNSHLLGPGWEDYDPRKHDWKQPGPEDQFC